MGGQIVTFWLGQCGIQLANSCWELLTLEHGLLADGTNSEIDFDKDMSFENFFLQTGSNKFTPRTLLVDLEPTVIDEIRLGKYRNLFNPDSLINSFEDAANNFARGYYSSGKNALQKVVYMTRKTVESCNNVQAFLINHSFGGGTGSGFTAMLMEYLSVEYGKRNKIECGVFPSPTLNTSVVEPYNTVLALHAPMENSDLAAFFENESLFRLCQDNLDFNEITFTNINRLLAQMISGTTASLRFEGPVNANIVDLQTNLVPYPRIHFPLFSFYPLVGMNKIDSANLTTKEISEQVFLKENQMSSVDPKDGSYMSCCLLFRGDINILDANNAINNLKRKWSMSWVDWCPTGFKIGINYQPMLVIPGSGLGYSRRSVSLLCNTTAFRKVLGKVNRKYLILFNRKAFIHWYVAEGLEEIEFSEAIENLLTLEKDYEIIEETAGAQGIDMLASTKTTPSNKMSNKSENSTSKVEVESTRSTSRSSRNKTSISDYNSDNYMPNAKDFNLSNVTHSYQTPKIVREADLNERNTSAQYSDPDPKESTSLNNHKNVTNILNQSNSIRYGESSSLKNEAAEYFIIENGLQIIDETDDSQEILF